MELSTWNSGIGISISASSFIIASSQAVALVWFGCPDRASYLAERCSALNSSCQLKITLLFQHFSP
jgi:hypothetical protein